MTTTALSTLAQKIGQLTSLGRTGTCTAPGTTTTLTDARRLASRVENEVPDGQVFVVKFTKTATTISFYDGTVVSPTTNDEIRDSDNGLGAYYVGNTVIVSGSVANDGHYVILSVAAGVLGVAPGSLTIGGANPSVTLTTYEETWATDVDSATGTATLFPAINAPAAGHTYERWRLQVDSRLRVREALNRALTTRCFYWKIVPLGMLVNGDCQSTTGWTVTNAALTAATALAFPYRFGRYYFIMTPSAGAGYVYQDINAKEARTWGIAALFRAAGATTASLTAYNIDASAAIAISGDDFSITASGSPGSPWQCHLGSLTVPADCESVRIKLNGSANGIAVHAAWIILWPLGTTELPVPDEVINEDDIARVFRLEQGQSEAQATDWSLEEEPDAWLERRARGGLTIGGLGGSTGPFFYEKRTFYEELTYEADTTDCDPDWAAYLGALELANDIAQRQELLTTVKDADAWTRLAARRFTEAHEIDEIKAPKRQAIRVKRL